MKFQLVRFVKSVESLLRVDRRDAAVCKVALVTRDPIKPPRQTEAAAAQWFVLPARGRDLDNFITRNPSSQPNLAGRIPSVGFTPC